MNNKEQTEQPTSIEPALLQTNVVRRLFKAKQLIKIALNKLLQKEPDSIIFYWQRDGLNCKNASHECQDTEIYCYLLEKRCKPLGCKHWRYCH